MFIFNTQLLLIDIGSWFELIIVIASATLAMLLFAAATQGYWLTRNRLLESAAMLLIAFTLFRPGFWWDRVYPPYETIPAQEINALAERLPDKENLQMDVAGETLDGKFVEKTVLLLLGDAAAGEQRLSDAGLETRVEGDKVFVDNVVFGSPAQNAGLDFDWEIKSLRVTADRPAKYWMFLPALLFLGLIGWMQHRRKHTA